ncbi:HD domain-containing protein [Chitinophagaceae bacterium LB-8]|uniref:HD domain-containing protein n=1 Tax=Paraflavisolibacter caeni TaxID=2982496 RepID=A0A9X2XN14_9BACT|nr:HD domain-containing protein [Paraflavisolibacter caeni]MCU7548128.1 HD domain-containing protein [Paraflavisolibacter caeni]
MLPGYYNRSYNVQTLSREDVLFEKILQSGWWTRATQCVDSHYSNVDGVMLSDHLVAVTENIYKVFHRRQSSFQSKLFDILDRMNIDRQKLMDELRIVALLHDIGKVECDKTKLVRHPLYKHFTIKRHSIVSLYAAIEILQNETLLSVIEKLRIYSVIEEHDVSYGLFCEWMRTGKLPTTKRWKELNDNVDTRPGVGLMYLLFFKLADTHGHWNLTDVVWFFKQVKTNYFNNLNIDLPIPTEKDIRL